MDWYMKKFDLKTIDKLKEENVIVNGSKGGLLLGPSHEEGGIIILVKYGDYYSLYGEAEGYEYIISPDLIDIALLDYQFELINDRLRDISFNFNGEEDLSKITTIDAKLTITSNKYKSKYVLLDNRRFAIINKNSTKRYLREIECINNNQEIEYDRETDNIIYSEEKGILSRLWFNFKKLWI
ncbi:hypothetical protein [uncultured Dokdonia sp.]|uniref:hypothetical protein n=1 Tax=uncultured Dokdonia sp. TaxID=575653 RepID=UPI0026335D2E|nr:hypothetical protein [uncultured Dokdonia sp.]